MRIPRKITPDGLTDAMVVVRYAATEMPPEVFTRRILPGV